MSEEKVPIVTKAHIEDEMKDSYLRYSMSVIVSRALPDVRDGLKPVHRRVLFGMHDLGVYPGKPYKKSARIVGDVIGKYHPHGDTAVYDTLVRMAQDFSLRYPLVDGQGNFGSIDGDSPAAMRYTEARMQKFGELMLGDLEKDTVDYVPNYDDSESEPSVLPSAFPNLLVNGSTGIAVGMATSMPPHNLREIVKAIHKVIENRDIPVEDLLEYVSGPDFPTGAIIYGRAGIRSAFLTGRGKVRVRARHHMETTATKRERIIVTEIPYQVNKSNLIEKMAGLVREKKVEGISDLRDESDRHGIRMVIELKKDAISDVVLANLYKYTQLQDTFSIYNLALVDRQPKVLNLKEMITHFIDHRHNILVRKTQFELKKAKDRAHILEGLRIAQDNIDEVVRVIRGSDNSEAARNRLIERFNLSEIQAKAIVDMRLGQLTKLDINKIENEYNELLTRIADFEDILSNHERRMKIIGDDLQVLTDKFGDERRTSIEEATDDIDIEDLIPNDPMVITMSDTGYVKRIPVDTYKSQHRGGKGITGSGLKDEDHIKSLFVANNHNYLLAFTNLGRVHWLKVYHIPEASRTAKGKAIINMIGLQEGETVAEIVKVEDFDVKQSIVLVTKNGTINKMDINLFSRPRKGGIHAIALDTGDVLVEALLAQEESNLLIGTRKGKSICFPPSAFRSMGRGTRGVRGMKLDAEDYVIGMVVLRVGTNVLTVTEKGFGKRTNPGEYRVTNRGGKGIKNLKVTEKNGDAVAILAVEDDSDIIITTKKGIVIRLSVSSVRLIGRDSQGVRVIRLKDDDEVMDIASLPSSVEESVGEGAIDAEIVEEVAGDESHNAEDAVDAEEVEQSDDSSAEEE
ncbi:MAG: DNA gyrase subunit A [Fibrobacterales bacterium]